MSSLETEAAAAAVKGNWKPIYHESDLERKFHRKLSIGIHISEMMR